MNLVAARWLTNNECWLKKADHDEPGSSRMADQQWACWLKKADHDGLGSSKMTGQR
jgi:hypothetical protein